MSSKSGQGKNKKSHLTKYKNYTDNDFLEKNSDKQKRKRQDKEKFVENGSDKFKKNKIKHIDLISDDSDTEHSDPIITNKKIQKSGSSQTKVKKDDKSKKKNFFPIFDIISTDEEFDSEPFLDMKKEKSGKSIKKIKKDSSSKKKVSTKIFESISSDDEAHKEIADPPNDSKKRKKEGKKIIDLTKQEEKPDNTTKKSSKGKKVEEYFSGPDLSDDYTEKVSKKSKKSEVSVQIEHVEMNVKKGTKTSKTSSNLETSRQSVSNTLNNSQSTSSKVNSRLNHHPYSDESKSTSNSSAPDYYQQHRIEISGDRTYDPITSFDQIDVDEDTRNYLLNFKKPTPIQASCWPICLSGRDVIGIAETGSGKTLAFTIPAIKHVKKNSSFKKSSPNPLILILAPTRELAMQIQEQIEEIDSVSCGKSLCVYGGVPKEPQRKDLRKGTKVIVATPGRLIDFIDEGSCDISNVSYLVLDEADRMLDIGFEKDIRKIISKTNSKRQTLMFSATWPDSVRKLAEDFLKDPVKVNIGSSELAANNDVTQIVEILSNPNEKEKRLVQLLKEYHGNRSNRVLVFVLYKKEATRIENFLTYSGFEVQSIHGDKGQFQRTEALRAFKDGTYPLLVATDVAARGLDIPDVEYVINYTFPLTIEDYVHRIGRTGRAGAKGTSHTFFTVHDKSHSGELINILKKAKQNVPEALLNFGGTVKKKEHKVYGAFYKDIDPSAKPKKIIFDD
ncbi:2950_t:CDS:2 [Ambispora leptoticha]|uniref:RNA helicase n=1 Tax=Ambispora leptoticha TaxID=144679 RepID=A0A9N8VQI6_9GLOM|nr:2950_t:CDS:2 [Ambispora leptoticha]